MKRFLLIVGGGIILFLSVIAFVNYNVDPGHIYHEEYINKIIGGVKNKQCVEGVANVDERLYKNRLTEANNGCSFDVLVLGPSRAMILSEDAFLGLSLLNLGVSGCKIEDMMALVYACHNNDIHYNNVVIIVDPTLFNGSDDDTRWRSLQSYYEGFLGVNSQESFYAPAFDNLLSVSYFQSSLFYLWDIVLGNNHQLRYVNTYVNNELTYRPDGSIYYGRKYRDKPQETIDREVLQWNHSSYYHFDVISKERVELFEKLIFRLKENGVSVVFLKLPFHPSFYKRVVGMKGAVDAMGFIDGFAQQNEIKFVGSFNPQNVGFTNNDFYDAVHPRKESVDKLLIQLFGTRNSDTLLEKQKY